MPDYRTIPPTIEGPCLYTITGKCCVFNFIDGKLVQACSPDWCCPPKLARVKVEPDFWDGIFGTEGQ